jgi:hypothetical protein
MPIEGECENCNGLGCEECDGTGRIRITSCPLEVITPDVWEAIRFAELYEKGLPPVAGGALDQAANFIEAAMYIFSVQNYWKNKLGVFE